MWRLAWQLLRDHSLADDVTQDAFLRAYRFLPRYRGEARFSTWLFAITRNCALDEIRRAGRRRELTHRLEPDGGQGSDESARVEVREALGCLPLELREPVVLIDMFGSSYRDVAHILDVPLGTVKSRVHRARNLLARWLLGTFEEKTHEA